MLFRSGQHMGTPAALDGLSGFVVKLVPAGVAKRLVLVDDLLVAVAQRAHLAAGDVLVTAAVGAGADALRFL